MDVLLLEFDDSDGVTASVVVYEDAEDAGWLKEAREMEEEITGFLCDKTDWDCE